MLRCHQLSSTGQARPREWRTVCRLQWKRQGTVLGRHLRPTSRPSMEICNYLSNKRIIEMVRPTNQPSQGLDEPKKQLHFCVRFSYFNAFLSRTKLSMQIVRKHVVSKVRPLDFVLTSRRFPSRRHMRSVPKRSLRCCSKCREQY